MNSPTDYFSDSPESAEAPEPKAGKSETKTALLPLNFFQGKELKPGETCEVRISEVMDDQVSVEYVGSESEEPEMSDVVEEKIAEAPAEDFMG